jgi:transcription initiation factor IIE alpha subunit
MPRNDTKKALIISMMERKGGATNAEMVSATGWVINSVRGQVSALRKSGYTITPEKRADGQRAYIVKERQAPSGQR